MTQAIIIGIALFLGYVAVKEIRSALRECL